jgi:hypothetical protein
MDELVAHGVVGNSLCQREIHPKKLLELWSTFLLNVATNPIDFFYVMWLTLKAQIRGLSIEYKSN